MKISIPSQIPWTIRLIWHCLWVTTLFAFLTGGVAVAATINVPGPNPDSAYTINATDGTQIMGEDIGTNASGNVFWDFATSPPADCGAGPTSYTCNGVTITLPAGSPGSAVPNTAVTTVSGTPTAPALFTFRLAVTLEDGSAAGERTFELDISKPKVPFDMSFVIDRSGSMGESTGVTPPATNRWEALKNGVNGFTPLIESTASSIPGNSRFGLTLFSTDVLTNDSFPATLTNIGNTLDINVDTELNSQTPGGWTGMGKGLKVGIAKMTEPLPLRVVVLFTDGEQNQNPEVNLNGRGYSDGMSINPIYPAGPGSIKIVTVGVGAPSGNYLTTLQNLAHENRGKSIITSNGSNYEGDCTGDVQAAFDCAIADALSGNSPLMVDSYSGTLAGAPVTLPAFNINHNLKQLLIKLSFTNNFRSDELRRLLAGIRISKDGTDITPYFQPMIVGKSTNTAILRTVFALPKKVETKIPSEGRYEIQMTKPEGFNNLDYRVIPYADDSRLDMEWGVSPALPRVNRPFQPTVNLSWRGVPLTDATVEAIILQPGDDLGDLLARNPQVVQPKRDKQDIGSPGYQKYLYLLKNDRKFLEQLAPNQKQLKLTHRGKGLYTADYNPGDISGVYQFYYRIRAKDPETGSPIQRLAVESVYTRFGTIDLNASSISTSVKDSNTIVVNWQPMTRKGRFIGPDQGTALSIDGFKLTKVQDNQDGSYTLTFTGSLKPSVTVKLLGEKIYKGPIEQFGQRGSQ